jgi:hypothetical protein
MPPGFSPGATLNIGAPKGEAAEFRGGDEMADIGGGAANPEEVPPGIETSGSVLDLG